jgi:hypothetical protein
MLWGVWPEFFGWRRRIEEVRKKRFTDKKEMAIVSKYEHFVAFYQR